MTITGKKFLKYAGFLGLAFLLLMAVGYFSVLFGWTNTAGEADKNSFEYNQIAEESALKPMATSAIKIVEATSTMLGLSNDFATSSFEAIDLCKIRQMAVDYSYNARAMFDSWQKQRSTVELDKMILAVKLRATNRAMLEQELKKCEMTSDKLEESDVENLLMNSSDQSVFAWQNEEPWKIIKEAILKDKDKINEAASRAGIKPRMLVATAIVEQLRLYYTQRELFEKVFKPLKILANANKMAWGVMSIKEKAAIETENNLKNQSSAFYLGADYEKLLDYPTDTKDVAKERYNRLADEKNHYYSYLYGALILKEIESQWLRAGYDISQRPEILATLFNIGYGRSVPKAEPMVGGSVIEINGQKYQFGSLAYEFYYSGELANDFPF